MITSEINREAYNRDKELRKFDRLPSDFWVWYHNGLLMGNGYESEGEVILAMRGRGGLRVQPNVVELQKPTIEPWEY